MIRCLCDEEIRIKSRIASSQRLPYIRIMSHFDYIGFLQSLDRAFHISSLIGSATLSTCSCRYCVAGHATGRERHTI